MGLLQLPARVQYQPTILTRGYFLDIIIIPPCQKMVPMVPNCPPYSTPPRSASPDAQLRSLAYLDPAAASTLAARRTQAAPTVQARIVRHSQQQQVPYQPTGAVLSTRAPPQQAWQARAAPAATAQGTAAGVTAAGTSRPAAAQHAASAPQRGRQPITLTSMISFRSSSGGDASVASSVTAASGAGTAGPDAALHPAGGGAAGYRVGTITSAMGAGNASSSGGANQNVAPTIVTGGSGGGGAGATVSHAPVVLAHGRPETKATGLVLREWGALYPQAWQHMWGGAAGAGGSGAVGAGGGGMVVVERQDAADRRRAAAGAGARGKVRPGGWSGVGYGWGAYRMCSLVWWASAASRVQAGGFQCAMLLSVSQACYLNEKYYKHQVMAR